MRATLLPFWFGLQGILLYYRATGLNAWPWLWVLAPTWILLAALVFVSFLALLARVA